MGKFGWWVACRIAAWGVLSGIAGGGPATAAAAPPSSEDDLPSRTVRLEVREAAHRAVVDGDARGRPFAIVDKKQARLLVFHADGRLAGMAPALLGQAAGDRAVPGIGRRAAGQIAPHERTTPAGRFDSEPGRNHLGEAIVWVDYDAALAIHRLRPAPAHERRAQRLASPTPEDNRISAGCIVVETAFYDAVVAPILGRRRGVVYVLPESAPAAAAVAPAGRVALGSDAGPSP